MGPVDVANLRRTIEKLASWPNRNSNQDTLFECADWLESELRLISGMQVRRMPFVIEEGKRVPQRREIVQLFATLPGESPDIVMIGAHFDTLNLSDTLHGVAPGANDDGSGIACVLECARLLAEMPRRRTLGFALFAAEEQGLLGAKAMARTAREEGWKIHAFLNNDMIGNSEDDQGRYGGEDVRAYSVEGPSRELARFAEWTQRRSGSPHRVRLVLRHDRFGRGGDHTPFNHEGFTAIRFVESAEAYSRQHTPQDLPEHVDFEYLAKNTAINLLVSSQIAASEPDPSEVRIDRKQGYGAQISWQGEPTQVYRVYWRETTSAAWQGAEDVEGTQAFLSLHKDDHEFAVGSIGGLPVAAE